MRKYSPLFHLLNSLTCCNNSFNRIALRISRGLCEAGEALPSRRECSDHDHCCSNYTNRKSGYKGRSNNHRH